MGPIRLSRASIVLCALCLSAPVAARGAAVARQASDDAATPTVTAVSDCHLHGTEVACVVGTTEYHVDTTITATEELPAAFTGCHSHDSELFCLDPSGNDVEAVLATEEEEGDHDDHDDHDDHEGEDDHDEDEHTNEDGVTCHFHAGVEHCTGGTSEQASESSVRCDRVERDYNVPLRVGLLFVVLVTSSIGVFGPIFLQRFLPPKANIVIVVLKQFGTGVIISTAFVHLFTHAVLMFQNECLGEVHYESTAAAILMAGIFISFLIEYCGQRYIQWREKKKVAAAGGDPTHVHHVSNEAVTITVMEAGVLFHSLLIGLTLVVAADSFFITLFAVIVFHQFFEGVALGSRIAVLGTSGKISALSALGCGHTHNGHNNNTQEVLTESQTGSLKEGSPACQPSNGNHHAVHDGDSVEVHPFPMWKKLMYASFFAIITPLGMAIGIGVLNKFNGNDPATLVTIGFLDAFSAGILVWVGAVEMWAADWMHGELSQAGPFKTAMALTGLVGGLAAMSALGKWA